MDVFAATDLTAFTITAGAPTEVTTAGTFETPYSVKAIYLDGATARSARFINPTTGADVSLTDGWLHFSLHWKSQSEPFDDNYSIALVNSAGTPVIRIFTDTNFTVRLDYWNGAAWVVGTTSTPLNNNTLHRFDLQFVCGALGELNLYVDEDITEPFLSVTGLNAAVTNAAFIDINSDNQAENKFSQFLVSEESTVGARVASLVPNSNGAYIAWSNDYANVVKLGQNDATLISSSTLNDRESYGASDGASLPYISSVISSVWFNARAKKSGGSPTNVRAMVRMGGVDYDAAYDFPNLDNASFKPGLAAFVNNPATAAAWTVAEINAAEIGFKATA